MDNNSTQGQPGNGSFDLNVNPAQPEGPMNPLNTGNGIPGINPESQMPTAPVTPMEATPMEPHPITPVEITTEQTPVGQTLENNLSTPVVASTEVPVTGKVKKYIISAIAAVLFLTAGYVGYSYFLGGNIDVEDENDTPAVTNSLSDSTETSDKDLEKLEEVVDDLKEIYTEPDPAVDGPPAINIGGNTDTGPEPESTDVKPTPETDMDPAPDTDTKVLR